MRKYRLLFLLFSLFVVSFVYPYSPKFSTAGFYPLEHTGRQTYSMNVAWRFFKGDEVKAEDKEYDDTKWQVVSVPHGIEYLPTEASGCVNYQGVVWYRKHFNPAEEWTGKKVFLHFEAIMGKCKIWINGKLKTEHYGGYLPVIVDLTDDLIYGEDNVIAVKADNSNDPLYPHGKAQELLDFSYFGGIYRDCWLVTHNCTYITDPNYENEVAGGGLFVAYDYVSKQQATIKLKTHIRNEGTSGFLGKVVYELALPDGKIVATATNNIRLNKNKAGSTATEMTIRSPRLWSPESPYLYHLNVYIKDNKGKVIDGYMRRIGVRSVEFKGKDGFWLNGEPYEGKLIGTNRHQDFAVVGNALSNSLHWRDAKKIRDAGLKVVRNAHYPQDPAFMDACDELGLFVIVNTPGWQFWNNDPVFGQRVYNDIRNMVRRDRNHPSVWMWEPVLNETHYPADFAGNSYRVVKEEYPYSYCYAGCDSGAHGNEYFDVLFSHPTDNMNPSKCYFTREWGDNVDDWNAHNSTSRVHLSWGEIPQLVQAAHYANPPYDFTCLEKLNSTSRQHVGGSFWHSFDHQRGYHPDPFYGGMMDVFRQPKYSYWMFMSQRSPLQSNILAQTGPMIFIAHEMSPFSSKDVTVYSNCDEIRLTVFKDGKQYTYRKENRSVGMASPIITFPDVFRFMDYKKLSRAHRQEEVFMLAEGYIDGKLVATHRRSPALRPEKIVLWVDDEGTGVTANGADLVTVVAGIADKEGNIKRLNNYFVKFDVEGEATIVGGEDVMANPRPVVWGTAPVLLRSTTRSGKIKVTASVLKEGLEMPLRTELVIESHKESIPMLWNEKELMEGEKKTEVKNQDFNPQNNEKLLRENELLKRELNQYRLRAVENQQEEFGENPVKKPLAQCEGTVLRKQLYQSFVPKQLWYDNNGMHINAHGGGMLYDEGTYYWFGEHKIAGSEGNKAQVGVRCYSSKDLYNWTDEGVALAVDSVGSGSDIEKGCILERPKVIYNAQTKKYVMWFHLELKSEGYKAARSGVAVSNNITGPYKFVKSMRPNAGHWPMNVLPLHKSSNIPSQGKSYTGSGMPTHTDSLNILGRDFQGGQMARDMTLFVDDDGKAYHIYSSEENSTMHIAELSDDYLSHTGRYVRVFVNRYMEAPTIFKRNGKYYFIGSGCTGWKPNAARSAVAESIWGPWKELGNPCRGINSELTFGGQSTYIFKVQGMQDSYLFMADEWRPDDAIDGRYIWLPVTFENDNPLIYWKDDWKF